MVAADEAHKAALLQASEEAEAEKRRMEEERAAAESEYIAAALRGEQELSTARGEASKLGGELVMATKDKKELVLQLQAWKVGTKYHSYQRWYHVRGFPIFIQIYSCRPGRHVRRLCQY